jgi:hypothetical protein
MFELPHLGQARQAIFTVQNVDDVPHDRTPLLDIWDHESTDLFPVIFAEPGKWLRLGVTSFRRRPGTKQLHGIESVRDRAGGPDMRWAPVDRPDSPQGPDSPAAFLESWRGLYPALPQRTRPPTEAAYMAPIHSAPARFNNSGGRATSV